MTTPVAIHFRRSTHSLWKCCDDDHGAQILEFALSLPLLVLFVIGIFDFTGAITLKQKLTNAARDAARVAAADPMADVSDSSAGYPVAVSDAYQVVVNYLAAENINGCGLAAATPAQSGATLTWIATASSCPGGTTTPLTLTINCGCLAVPAGQTTSDMVNTCVTIQYPYIWQFGGISSLFGTVVLPTSITTTAVAFNEN